MRSTENKKSTISDVNQQGAKRSRTKRHETSSLVYNEKNAFKVHNSRFCKFFSAFKVHLVEIHRSTLLLKCPETGRGPPVTQLTGSPPIIISEITHRYHNRYQKYCLLSEEWKPVRKNPPQSLVLCTYGDPTGPFAASQCLRGPYLRHGALRYHT